MHAHRPLSWQLSHLYGKQHESSPVRRRGLAEIGWLIGRGKRGEGGGDESVASFGEIKHLWEKGSVHVFFRMSVPCGVLWVSKCSNH